MANDNVIASGASPQERERQKRAEWAFAGTLGTIAFTSCIWWPYVYPFVDALGLKTLSLPAMLGVFWIPPAVLIGGSVIFLMRSAACKRRMSRGGCWKCGYTVVAAGEWIDSKPATRKCPECARETQLLWIPRAHADSMRRGGFGIFIGDVFRTEDDAKAQGR